MRVHLGTVIAILIITMEKTFSQAQNRRKARKRAKIARLILIALVVISACGTTAWATLSFVKPHETTHQIEEKGSISEIPSSHPEEKKSRAPEPSTIALFGSGLLAMIISIVRKTYYITKRIFDIVISTLALIILSPLYLCVALLLKVTSPGPVIFTQTRTGKNGTPFIIYKFRTMHVDAEKDTGPVWATANDNRLIPAGAFIRQAHIDEIPQFVNVLRGEMSVIGPRPERPVFVKQFKKIIHDYGRRLEVKPGITGLAQVWHKYDETIEDVKKKIKYDILYIKRICLWTDLRILFRTIRVVLTGEGAR